MKKFPSAEFLVVTSEWKPSEDEAHKALDQTEKIIHKPINGTKKRIQLNNWEE